jgi:hypothetical protein
LKLQLSLLLLYCELQNKNETTTHFPFWKYSVVIESFPPPPCCCVLPSYRVPLPRNVVRTYMSTLTQTAPRDDECLFMLILGKPGGGKGTISGKILRVRCSLDVQLTIL